MKVGFVGLGAMGSAMAESLLQAGHALTVYNRSRNKAEALGRRGAEVAGSAAEAASSTDVVITMLADDHALEAVVFGDNGLLDTLTLGAIHVSMSTISIALSEKLTVAHAKRQQRFVAAPVFGRPEAAMAAKLFVVAAGHKDAIASCEPLFDALGQRTFVVSDQPAQANLVKLSGNFLIASVIESLAEAFALTGKGGVDANLYLEVLTNTLFSAPVYKTYGGLIAEERYEPAGFTAQLGLKDVQLALEAGKDLKVPMPVASLIADRLLALIAGGGGNLDWSALGKLAKRDAGAARSLTE